MSIATTDVIQYPTKQAIRLRNRNCVYCGATFGDDRPATKEHVVGRRFVPRGSLDGLWNLVVEACKRCNSDKADLEDDISAISMLPDLLGGFSVEDQRLAAEARRKSIGARSRRTGKVVADSREKIELQQRSGTAKFTFAFTAPPQIDEHRIFRLAHYHFRAFFFLITFQQSTQTGGFVRGGFFPIATTRRADWGNPRMRWFMDLVRDWDLRIHAIGADTFFKIIIRRHPDGKEVWAWALEWNHSIRVVGFAGDEAAVYAVASEAPEVPLDTVHEEPGKWLRMRVDVPIADSDDDLFTVHLDSDDEVIT